MAGETEAAPEAIVSPGMDTIRINEMRVLVKGGPRHYVRVTIPEGTRESWLVDHQPVMVTLNDVVGFVDDADADHFISRGRAESLGRWENFDDLRKAYEAVIAQHAAKPAPAPAEKPAKKGKA